MSNTNNILQTGFLTGGNIDVIIDMMFGADMDTNPAKELNFLEEQLDDARATYQTLEMELADSTQESFLYKLIPSAKILRTENEIRHDMSICMEMISQIERMIAQRESLFNQ